jgi:hypothetical protein
MTSEKRDGLRSEREPPRSIGLQNFEVPRIERAGL